MRTDRELKWRVQENLDCELRQGEPCTTCLYEGLRCLNEMASRQETNTEEHGTESLKGVEV